MVVRRISALPTRFILGQEPSCGLSFSPTRPARSGACRIPVKNTPRPAQLRFCLHTPLSPMRLPSALSVFPLFSNTGTYQPFFCLRPFSGKILSGRMPAVMRQAGQNLPGVLEASCKQKAPKPRHPSRIVFGSGASIFMTVSCHTICSRHTPVPSDISCNVEVITLEQNNRTTMIARVICAERCRLLVCDCSSHQRVLVRSDDACCFSRGDCVCIHYSGAMTMSIPPQITADCIHRHCA